MFSPLRRVLHYAGGGIPPLSLVHLPAHTWRPFSHCPFGGSSAVHEL